MRLEVDAHEIYIGNWINKNDYIKWKFQVPETRSYQIAMVYGCAPGQGGAYAISINEPDEVRDHRGSYAVQKGDTEIIQQSQSTGGSHVYKLHIVGEGEFKQGDNSLAVKFVDIDDVKALMNLKKVVLIPME
jgi:hypothetical protein